MRTYWKVHETNEYDCDSGARMVRVYMTPVYARVFV